MIIKRELNGRYTIRLNRQEYDALSKLVEHGMADMEDSDIVESLLESELSGLESFKNVVSLPKLGYGESYRVKP